jgi:hypothetical protein|tara:strand:+ start:2671 stop:2892 length:222 start_codon:yes stop_codon:yes gene_type:complete
MSKQQERKAEKILNKVTKVEDNTWILPSASDETKLHTVTKSTGEYECDCVGYQFTLNCYHVIAVKMSNNEEVM